MNFRHELVLPNDDLPFRIFVFEGKDGNYKVNKHWHHSIEIFLVLNGEISFYINSKPFILKENDFVIVNTNQIHSIDSPTPNLTIVLQIPTEIFVDYMNDSEYIHFQQPNCEQNKKISYLVEKMYLTYIEKEYGYSLKVRGKFYELLYVLISECKEENIDKEILMQKKHLDKISNVTSYLKLNYKKDLSLEQVANKFGFTNTYLSRIFHKYAEVSYKTYLTDVRVKNSVREMLNTNNQIGEIALNNGFSDSRAFSKAFKKRYDCLPSEYRKKITIENEIEIEIEIESEVG